MQMGKNLIDYHRVLDAGDSLYSTTAFTTGLDIDVENPLQSLCPGDGCATFGRRLVFRLIRRLGFVAFAPLRGRHLHTMLAVGCKHAVKPGEVASWFGYQRCQPCHEVQRFEDHMGSAVATGCFQLIAHLALRGQ